MSLSFDGRDAKRNDGKGGRRIRRDWLHDAKPCHVKPMVTCDVARQMRLPQGRPERHDRPWMYAYSLRRFSRLGRVSVLAVEGASALITRRPRHATPTTSSLSTLDSLQLLPWPTRREAREPPADTHTGLGRSGPPPNLHRGGKHHFGGRLQRRRYATPRHATPLGLDGRTGDATPLARNRTRTRGTQTDNATHGH